MKQCFSAAYGRFGIRSSLQQKLLANFLLCYRFALHKLLELLQVFIGIESNTLPFSSISSGTSGLLVISFQTFGNIIMDNITHIRFVNTHTKSNGSYNHINFFHQEIILVLCSCSRIHSGMIGTGIDSVCLQDFSKFLHFLPAQAIDNAWLFGIVLNELDDVPVYICSLGAYLIIEIRAVERWLEHLRIHHTQILLDVMLHFRCSRRSQRYQRGFSYFIDNGTDAAILRTEVMTPFRNTMGFVHGIERNLHRFQKLHILFLRQWFRSYIQQLCLTTEYVGPYLVYRALV